MSKLDIPKLVEILDSTDYPVLVEVNDCVNWYQINQEVYWVGYHNGELATYSGELPEGYTRQDGYFIANVDNQTGCWVTTIFSEANELSFDDFMDKYEDLM